MEIIVIRNSPHWAKRAAVWFHEKWGIPLEAYDESIGQCLQNQSPVPQWYLAVENQQILGGLGVIENDFHNRPDLCPNVCAVYVEENYRKQGIAGVLLNFVCKDFHAMKIDTLYLLTDHTNFYERYGWEYLCPVLGDGEEKPFRMYIHKM